MKKLCFILFLLFPLIVSANNFNDSFSKSKQLLEQFVYNTQEMRHTIYCNVSFNADKTINLPPDIVITKYKNRMHRIEWEHIVPAENFGRTFTEWREGHPDCVDSKGKAFKGRKCADKVNLEYRYMQADMHNLYPAIGSINAARSNFNFAMLPQEQSTFGACQMKIKNRKAEPPQNARGQIARAYLYMEATYPRYKMSKSQRQLMNAWNKQHPPTKEECHRANQINQLQGNENKVVKELCLPR